MYADDTLKERKKRELMVFTSGKKDYGYQLNINNSVLNVLYEHYKHIHGIAYAPSSKQRTDWERQLWEYLRKVYYTEYKKSIARYDDAPLKEQVTGYEHDRLADIVNYRMNVEKVIGILYRKENDNGKTRNEHSLCCCG